MVAPGWATPPTAPVGSMKIGRGGGQKGRNRPFPCLLALVFDVTRIVASTPP